ncbi:DegT/DnrJ/EryC1/StrS family aminotransferase [Exilibacterium tricleocarpae]|uniref:DegT/DnrJ/EryC1/StrS family aminotransferase n=1 Tax=Exilibacterium tricleocarpae TaxID=2591008 RepID=A0A545U499_9GAMM|nr:DegT/DnrJ/EryC1/StrS family aminotransferase [Exilibacterium tricleocarpae]TQV84223.1 DegT/DnrJ/EryC1/StrS family aminotransferase [Exilibacterium tricleocarpae]
MQFIDLNAQYRQIEKEINRRIKGVLEHGQYILGPEVSELEASLASFVGVRNCIAVSSGTDALLISLMALGVGHDDEVIVPAFTYIAPAEIVALLGAKPIYVDVDKKTYNLDPQLLEAAITENTKAVIPVSLYGQCADFDEINQIAEKYKLPVIEDGAQSFGALYKGRRSCGLTTVGTTSFFPSKPLGGYGDGGAVFTNDDELATVMRQISKHGQDYRYHHVRVGVNGRIDTLQAAVLLAKLVIFPQELELRGELGAKYTKLFNDICPEVKTPFINEWNSCVYAQYTIVLEHRDCVVNHLKQAGIPTAIHYPMSLNKQPAISDDAAFVPVSERLAKHVLSIPMHPNLSEEEQLIVVEELNRACTKAKIKTFGT